MNRTVRKAWISALRREGARKCTGSYALGLSNSDTAWGSLGGTGRLRQELRNPLGVLCELAVKAGVVERNDDVSVDASEVLEQVAPGCTGCDVASYGAEGAVRRLPAEVMSWAGLTDSAVRIGRHRYVCDLAADGMTFSDVADVLSCPWRRIR
jgi:hypothetical protein